MQASNEMAFISIGQPPEAARDESIGTQTDAGPSPASLNAIRPLLHYATIVIMRGMAIPRAAGLNAVRVHDEIR